MSGGRIRGCNRHLWVCLELRGWGLVGEKLGWSGTGGVGGGGLRGLGWGRWCRRLGVRGLESA